MVERLKQIIKEKGLSFSAVEKELGFGNGAIKRFSTNSPSAEKILQLSNFLNVSTDYLLKGTEPDNKALSKDEADLLKKYKDLEPIDKGKVLGYIDNMVGNKSIFSDKLFEAGTEIHFGVPTVENLHRIKK